MVLKIVEELVWASAENSHGLGSEFDACLSRALHVPGRHPGIQKGSAERIARPGRIDDWKCLDPDREDVPAFAHRHAFASLSQYGHLELLVESRHDGLGIVRA